ncbi:hypothetical protein D3C72_1460550 [compost metagenome]
MRQTRLIAIFILVKIDKTDLVMISFHEINHHWNYFLAIEKDLENLSRYIEFSENNLQTYSIEIAHILLSSSSEVDVILKQFCKLIEPNSNPNNINDYKNIILSSGSDIVNQKIVISRYGLEYKPFENWITDGENPVWWKSHNRVKHNRNEYYYQANLQNVVNSVGALLLVNIYFYEKQFSVNDDKESIGLLETTSKLKPESSFIKIPSEFYYKHLVVRV